MTKKLERDGKVAVIHSSSFGEEWSESICDKEFREFLMFDSELALAVLDQNFDDIRRILSAFRPDNDIFCWSLALYNLDIRWIEKGKKFTIREFDGLEEIITGDDLLDVA